MLKNNAHPLPQAAQRFAVEMCDIVVLDENTAGRGALQQVNQPQQRAFPGARPAYDAEHLALRHLEIDAVKCLEFTGAGAVGLVDLLNANHGASLQQTPDGQAVDGITHVHG